MSYIHGTSPDEQRRLSLMNDLANAGSLRELSAREGDRVLDLGTGLGQLTRGIARSVGRSGRVVGIESSPEQLAAARRLADADGEGSLMDLRAGDALSPPLSEEEWGTFDLVHARFLLEHLTDPGAAVRVMVRAARPGGRIVLEDDDHDVLRLWPEVPEFQAVWSAYQRALEAIGCDPWIGRRLPELLHDAGAPPVRSSWIPFGACAGSAAFPGTIANVLGILTGARATIVGRGGVDDRAFDRGLTALSAWSESPGASFGYAIAWAEGTRPA
ncbi:MAG TPA: methyltransferase domain-containing protein [Candidatus Polarisedimenticolaceae bacterium]|nr:methyltransferase domain-containing protein [Candidatus Polarisedimenticolaceae bacterium]